MARTRTLTLLIQDVRQRAGMESSQFVTDSEVTEYLNQSIAELYDLILAARGQEYFVASSPLAVSNGVQTYPIPATFLELLGVDVAIGGDTFTVRPYGFAERNAFNTYAAWAPLAWMPTQPIFYRLQGGNISFIPIPSGSFTVTLWYVPSAVRLVAGNDTFDGYNGWEEYVVVDAAMKCLEKEESDTSALTARKMWLKQRIDGMAGNRDAGFPERVTDVMGTGAYRGWVA